MARERIERGGEARHPQPPAGLNVAEIRQLVKLMADGDINEITIEQESAGLKLTLRKPTAATYIEGADDEFIFPDDPAQAGDESIEQQESTQTIGAPLVGVFRPNMKPDGKPLVAIGDTVREGQVVAAIEALNVFNEVEASHAGKIVEIRAENGQPVEYGQPLMIVEPLG